MQKNTEHSPVTVIMNTSCYYPEIEAQAIFSVMAQTLRPRPRFLIINSSKFPLRLSVDLNEYNIEVHNIDRPRIFPEQLVYGLSQVKTPYWTVVDSDDIVHPQHVERLYNLMLEAKKTTVSGQGLPWPVKTDPLDIALYVKGQKIPEVHKTGSWVSSMFERRPIQFYQGCLEEWMYRFDPKEDRGFDTIVRHPLHWNCKPIPKEIKKKMMLTYVYRVGVSYHISRKQFRKPFDPDVDPGVIVPTQGRNWTALLRSFNRRKGRKVLIHEPV